MDYGQLNKILKNSLHYLLNNMQYNLLIKKMCVSAYIVEVFNVSLRSNFELYEARVKDVLRNRK